MAPTGQVSAQEPQSMQVPASIIMCSSPMEIAPTGQPPSQAPQLMQVSLIAYAIVYTSERYVITNGQKCNRNFSAGAGV